MEGEKRKLIKFSNYSLCVTLPKWVIRKLNWKKGDVVDMQVDDSNGKIVITKGRKARTVKPKKASRPDHSKSTLRW